MMRDSHIKTHIEPFKIKTVEPIKFTTIEQREVILREAGYNPFLVAAEDVTIDLLTDSGTSAMSAKQWAGILDGDESYAGSRSFYRMERMVQQITGMAHMIPTHQGRAAERILFTILGGEGKVVPNNTHFDTTRANVEYSHALAVDCLNELGKRPGVMADFKGNMDIARLEAVINEAGPQNVPLVMITVTNNSGGGQPVSMENIRQTRAVCDKYGLPLFIDACRFAENAWFIKLREPGYADKTPLEIAQEMFSYADGVTMSAKKDALVNIGGFLAMQNEDLARECRNLLIVTEGFPTYGGLAGRDLEAIAQGLEEILDEDYLDYRISSTRYLGDGLTAAGVPIVLPPGGSAIYMDAMSFCDHIPAEQFPAQSVTCALYLDGGIRAVEIGGVMFGRFENGVYVAPPMELVRLALPRRVYTKSHLDYIIEVVTYVHARRAKLRGLRLTYEAPMLRHFTARFEYVG
jgi:tyrosine phenol-lyase